MRPNKYLDDVLGCMDWYEKKPDIAAKPIYPEIARAVLPELHRNLMQMLERDFHEEDKAKTLVVVGPGAEVLPYSENPEDIARLLNGGNLVLMDYNRNICDKIPAYLESRGFGKHFSIKRVEGEYDPRQANSTIFVEHRDIRNGYSLPAGSVDGVDMTLSVHHATQYECDMFDIWKKTYELLKSGGVFHIGEGNVDMKYSERKIRKIAEDILSLTGDSVEVLDNRFNGETPRQLFFGDTGKPSSTVCIDHIGMVAVRKSKERLFDHLQSLGYKLMVNGDIMVFPLIDHAMEEDYEGLIVPVRAYYNEVSQICAERLAERFKDDVRKALSKERSDALRGLVEYYSPPEMLIDNLRKVGFGVGKVTYTELGPFVNIVGRK